MKVRKGGLRACLEDTNSSALASEGIAEVRKRETKSARGGHAYPLALVTGVQMNRLVLFVDLVVRNLLAVDSAAK